MFRCATFLRKTHPEEEEEEEEEEGLFKSKAVNWVEDSERDRATSRRRTRRRTRRRRRRRVIQS